MQLPPANSGLLISNLMYLSQNHFLFPLTLLYQAFMLIITLTTTAKPGTKLNCAELLRTTGHWFSSFLNSFKPEFFLMDIP